MTAFRVPMDLVPTAHQIRRCLADAGDAGLSLPEILSNTHGVTLDHAITVLTCWLNQEPRVVAQLGPHGGYRYRLVVR